ncbi:hypothetical protein BGW38_009344 [Lunasporangiospora selenospora]|uniref:Uncharacterized protein n=1 Tax=Lunasporangiospora selenospora TaxID=979761 RepID=A0A9P6FY03_9FUNG|nr:hypothetical protein BGW38_009344 [Lunasporangiospora selenospora]
MDQQSPIHPDQDFEDGARDLDGSTSWIDPDIAMVWVILPGLFNYDEYKLAKLSGKGEEYIKGNCTFYAPYSQLYNKKAWVYRDASNKSTKTKT